MRALAATTLSIAMLSASPVVLAAQKGVSAFDGVWHGVEVRIVRPDSTVMRPPSQGVIIILHGHFSQIWVAPAPSGVQQAARLTTAEEKAARYDVLSANAGTFEATSDSTFTLHYEHAKNPAAVGTSFTTHYRLGADSLWLIGTSRWAKDTTKIVRTTAKYVREK